MSGWVLAALSAVLSVLVFPRFDLVWLAPLCLAPLIAAAAREQVAKRRFLQGWLAGAMFWFGVCYWIQAVLEDYGGVGAAGGWAVFLLFCLAKGLHWAVFQWLAGYLTRGWWALPAIAALWTGIERTNGPFGFAWLCLGNAGIEMGAPMRLAPLTGVYGLSFVFALMNAAVALGALRRPRAHLAPALALPLLFLLPPMPELEPGDQVAVAVQPNIEEKSDWGRERLEDTIRRMGMLSLGQALSQKPGPNLILWPEAPVPFYWESDPFLREQVAKLARATQSTVMFAGVGRAPDSGPFNSAYVIDRSGELLGRYDKMYLVPFGEFVPPPFDRFVKQISDEAGTFMPGRTLRTFPNGSDRLGLFICYESAFPHFVREFAAAGATVLVNLSNDGYFGASAAREQHLQLVRMRAAENRRWILRATNDGITVTVEPSGRITQQLPAYREFAARTRFSSRRDRTPYTEHGDWFAWGCLTVSVLLAGIGFLGRKRPDGRSEDIGSAGPVNGAA